MPRLLFLSIGLMLATVAAGCSDSAPATDSGKPRNSAPVQVVATVGMVADIVREVGGPQVQVTQICGSGVDPHLYKVTRDDVKVIMGADLVFYSGLMLEGKMTDTLVKVARSKPVVAVTESIPESTLLEPDDFAGHYDPHVWMDVSAWAECVSVVAQNLADFDPDHATDYQTRATEYSTRLEELHSYGQQTIDTIPEDSRVLITSHDAFNYFGRAYNLEVLGVQGLSTESEAGLQHINELVDLIVDRRIQAVFVESSVPRKNIDALVEGARSRGHNVRVGGELYSDAMGSEGTYEGTYIGMLDHNITLVARMLGGEAPEQGMQGRLQAVKQNGGE